MYQRRPPYRVAATAVSAPSLLGQVLGITAIAFLVTAAASYLFPNVSSGVGTIAFVVGFVLIFVMHRVRENPATALMVFYGFAFLEGIGLSPMLARFLHTTAGATIVTEAAATTGLGMLVIGALAYAISVNYRKLSGIGTIALLALIVASLVNVFLHVFHPGTIAWMTLAVFTVLTLADFARIRAGGDGSTPVELALSIYLDALNIFIALLQLFGLRSNDD